jgi:menaquinone-specific isochorismate synthase
MQPVLYVIVNINDKIYICLKKFQQMEHSVSKSVGDLLKFIAGQEADLKKKSVSTLVSFAVKLEGDNNFFCTRLNQVIKSSVKSFYFRQPDKNYCFAGINACVTISENGHARFAATDKKIKEWKDRVINNWEIINTARIPLFVGGMKFTVEHPDEIWNDYNDSSWFIPEYLILENKGETYFIYNFIYQKGSDKNTVSEKYRRVFENIAGSPAAPASSVNAVIKEAEGSSPKDKKKWKQLVSAGIEDLLDKKVEKIVYSRKVEYTISKGPDFNFITGYLSEKYPGCSVFIFHQGSSVFFGATPEKLAAFSGGKIEIDALAGSARRGNDPSEDEKITSSLLTDNKNLAEHNFVVNYIISALKAFSSDIEQGAAGIKKLQNIQHIYTAISARVKASGLMFSLLNELFPTPAVCGLPKKTALENIKKNEPHNRGLYAGLTGWLNLNEEAEFVVAIRSAIIKNNRLYVYAGSGIVANSDPEEEFIETELKLKPILSIFRNENKN